MKLKRLEGKHGASPSSVKLAPPATLAADGVKVGMDDLTATERAAANLGVEPDALQPMQWLNDKHFEHLKKTNALGDTLARQIEAHRVVSSGQTTG